MPTPVSDESLATMALPPSPAPEAAPELEAEEAQVPPETRTPAKLKEAPRIEEPAHPYRNMAGVLSRLASWVYSDAETMASHLPGRLRLHEFFSVRNPAMQIVSTGALVVDRAKRTAVICFRGTEPKNITNWLTDMNMHLVPFDPERPGVGGRVHEGFLLNTAAILHDIVPVLHNLTEDARQEPPAPRSPAVERLRLRAQGLLPAVTVDDGDDDLGSAYDADSDTEAEAEAEAELEDEGDEGDAGGSEQGDEGDDDEPEEAAPAPAPEPWRLYITGHSLGAAMAVVAGALIVHSNPAFVELPLQSGTNARCRLAGVYTFGQPAVGDRDFVEHFQDRFTLHRYVFGADPIPRLPPAWSGYKHFKHEKVYFAQDRGELWAEATSPPLRLSLLRILVEMPLSFFLRRLPLRLTNSLTRSWMASAGDHSPARYVEASGCNVVVPLETLPAFVPGP